MARLGSARLGCAWTAVQSGCLDIDGVDDVETFDITREAMSKLVFTQNEVWQASQALLKQGVGYWLLAVGCWLLLIFMLVHRTRVRCGAWWLRCCTSGT